MNCKKFIFLILIVFSLPVFAQRIDYSMIPFRQGNLWGYARTDRSIVIKPAYDEANWFISGYAVVKKGGKYGYINSAGKMVIPAKFYVAKPFRYGYFDATGKHMEGGKMVQNADSVLFAGVAPKADGVEICINTKGQRMGKCPAINENTVQDNNQVVTVSSEKTYSLVNNQGLYDKLVDDYRMANDENAYYIGVKNNLYGVINNKFEVVLPFEYSSIKILNLNGTSYLETSKDGKYGMYRGNGTVYVPSDYSNISYLRASNGKDYFIVTRDGKAMVKDINFNDVIPADYTSIAYDPEGGFVLTGANNTKGYYFLSNMTIKPRYSDVRLLRGGKFLLVTTASGKLGYMSTDGTEYFEE
jgi:hypothetical protein